MKRIQAACICQTLRFALPDGTEAGNAAEITRQEVAQYKKGLEEKRIRHKIVSEQEQPCTHPLPPNPYGRSGFLTVSRGPGRKKRPGPRFPFIRPGLSAYP